MSETLYLLTICLPLVAILLIFGMRYFAIVQQAKAHLAHDEVYRQIAAKAVTAQAETATAMASIDATLSDLKSRLTQVEKILKEVE